jgi:Uma2 family endonuclease
MQIGNSPRRTTMEVFRMLPEGTLAEIINGSIVMSPAPSPEHQRVIRDLSFVLHQFVKQHQLGEVLFAPCDVFLDEHSNAVQPDIIFISKKNVGIIQKDSIHGIPDLLIEVLSPGNNHYDHVQKKELYQKFGVIEYWIVDPVTKDTFGFSLNDGSYQTIGEHAGMISSALLGQSFSF